MLEAPTHLIVLDAGGNELHRVELSFRGSMAAPSVADVDVDGALELVISLEDSLGGDQGGVQIWDLPGANDNCVLWGTGRGDPLRTGYVRPTESATVRASEPRCPCPRSCSSSSRPRAC